jgi:hypothetical protein
VGRNLLGVNYRIFFLYYFFILFYIHKSVHRNIITNYNQQDATFLDLFIFTDALHVSGRSSAHHQEHITVHTASGIVKPILLLAATVEEIELHLFHSSN